MSEKNTHSILESIRKKLHKFDQKLENKVSDVVSDLDYSASPKKEEVVKAPEINSFEKTSPENSSQKTKNSGLEDFDWDDEASVKPVVNQVVNNAQNTSGNTEFLDDFDDDDLEDFEDEVEFDEDEKEKNQEDDLAFDNADLENNEEQKIKESEPKKNDDDLNFDDLDLDLSNQEKKQEVKEAPAASTVDSNDLELDELEREIQRQKQEAEDEAKNDIHLELEKEMLGLKAMENQQENQSEAPQNLSTQSNSDDIANQFMEELVGKNPQEEIAIKEELFKEEPIKEELFKEELFKEESIKEDFQKEEALKEEAVLEEKSDSFVEDNFDVHDLLKETEKQMEQVVNQQVPASNIEKMSEPVVPLEMPPMAFSLDDHEELKIPEMPPMQVEVQVKNEIPMEVVNKTIEKKSLLNEATIQQTTDSVKKLLDAKNVISGISNFSQSPILAELATQLLEPKLERWLNENLSELVEKVVREEIKKIIPKGE